jgi:ribA/ribD-fused uncharacterized protein
MGHVKIERKDTVMKTICFTGHRPNKLGGYDTNNEKMTWVKAQLKECINRAYHAGFAHFISGGALGVDQVALSIVYEVQKEYAFDIITTVAKPFPSQACKWPESSIIEFNRLCNLADKVFDVSPDPYTAEKMQVRNEWMVDNADAVIAVWDGTPGGTANCVRYALEQKKHVLRIDPAMRTVAWIKSNLPSSDKKVIDSFEGQFSFLSNFYHCKFMYQGCSFDTAEHAFQWAKCINDEDRKLILEAETPAEAKHIGRKVCLRPDWDEARLKVMHDILYHKFIWDDALGAALLTTRDATLIEGNTWGDTYWGMCKGQGDNHLGEILMQVRSEIRDCVDKLTADEKLVLNK